MDATCHLSTSPNAQHGDGSTTVHSPFMPSPFSNASARFTRLVRLRHRSFLFMIRRRCRHRSGSAARSISTLRTLSHLARRTLAVSSWGVRRPAHSHHRCLVGELLRHTAAMDLMQVGVDRSVIALWLGHERVNCRVRQLTDNAEKLLMPNDVQESADSRRIPQHSLGINFGPQFPHRVVLPCHNTEDNQCLQCLTTSSRYRSHGSILRPSFLSSFTNSAVRGHPKATSLSIRARSATS